MSKKKENPFLNDSLPNLLTMREQHAHALCYARKRRNRTIWSTLLNDAEFCAAVLVAYMAKDQYIDYMTNTIENGTILKKIHAGFIGIGSGALALHVLLQNARAANDLVRNISMICDLKEVIKAMDEAIAIKNSEKGEK